MTQRTNARDVGLDVIRTMAIVMVITIHIAANCMYLPVGSADWWGAVVWGCVARPAVPLFLMCSGALMLGRDISLRRLYGHNMLHVVVAMLVWALVYQMISAFPTHSGLAGLWNAVKDTLLFRHEFHFYYLHILVLVYAFLPVTQVFVRSASRRELEYLLLFWFVTGIVFPLLQYIQPFSLIYLVGSRYLMSKAYASIGYGVLGLYLKRYGSGVPALWYWLALAAGLGITFGGTAFFSLRAGALEERFLNGMSPGPMLMALGLFGLMANREKWPAPVAMVSGRLALSSFCIYLAHVQVMRMEIDAGLNIYAAPCLVMIPLAAVAVLIPGHLCWEVLRHVPIVKTWFI